MSGVRLLLFLKDWFVKIHSNPPTSYYMYVSSKASTYWPNFSKCYMGDWVKLNATQHQFREIIQFTSSPLLHQQMLEINGIFKQIYTSRVGMFIKETAWRFVLAYFHIPSWNSLVDLKHFPHVSMETVFINIWLCIFFALEFYGQMISYPLHLKEKSSLGLN